MPRTHHSSTKGTLALLLSMLALVVALSGSAFAALAAGSVGTKQLAKAAVTKGKIKDGAVTAKKLAPGSVGGSAIADGSVDSAAVADRTLRLADLGGGLTNQVTTTSQPLSIAAGNCQSVFLRLENPSVAGTNGSWVVGTISNSVGGPVLSNAGFVVPTLLTPTSQGGTIYHLGVCAGGSSQTIPVGSVVRWSVIAP